MGDENLGYTPEEALSAIGFGKFQALTLVYAGLGWISEALEMMILPFVGIAVHSEWGISPGEESLLTTVVFIGMLFGAYFWGFISDAYGRRKGFLGVTIAVVVAAICSAFSPNYKLLLVFRCLLGFGVGGGHTFASWFLEFVSIPNRGAWLLALTGFWTCGTILEAFFAWIIMPRLGWRWLISLSCVPSFFVLVLYGLTTESPRYLATKGRTAEAQKILEEVAVTNGTKLPLGVLVCDKAIKIDEENSPSLDTPLLPSAREKNHYPETCLSSFLALFSTKLRRTTLLIWILYFANTFSYYGVVLLTSELSSEQSTCHSTTNVLKSVNDGRLYRDVLIATMAELPGLILEATIVDRIGRKLSMEIMCIFGFILLLPLVVQQNEIVTTALLFGSRMFIFSTFNLIVLYSREVYPTSVRASGVGIATSIGRIGGMICPLVAVGLVRGCHQTAAILLFEAMIILVGSCIFFLPFETSGKGLRDTLPSSDEE
ncbi:hypothetical protein M9H77_27876 [Catharanthus roseus]|uniref:Uncharacterized protein n=1 Tax=Catharanthus roseus TaxID=4058 RepID=A0ACC0ADS2_CATRO|nr:hypothetical protein M9H77_27876 [Catharanthus roseus]